MEDIFKQDITVINQYFNKVEKKTKYKVSYVKGFWSSNNGISINGTQLTKSDGLSARILMNDSRNETYQKPEEFKKEQKKLLEDYQNVIKIINIATKDYGSEDMWYFAITGA